MRSSGRLRRRVGLLVLAVGLLLSLVVLLAGAVLFATLAGDPQPSADELPELPDGYSVGTVHPGCGSGGCYLVADVEGPPGTTPGEMVDALAPVTQCRAHGLLDRRRLCTAVAVVGHDQVQVSVMLEDGG
ncbi:hypothetical protein [Nocardioides antri]|uniref:Uncharacterized protein n=1 Tax=Nocardioides antri TaxID=2607659 RepID=A0A5B1M3J1_9ACTN|nr:hypothetical protein [Nocardioides antri]KAA1426719.1 hypothetical protein F0U47_12140 [Nocardioides antri]